MSRRTLLVLHFRSENVVKDGGNSGGNKLTERQEFILALIREDHTISARVMSEKVSEKMSEKATERTIERELSKLKREGILSRVGGRKNGEWVINEQQTGIYKESR